MREPFAYLAYAPREPMLLCAVALFTVEKNVYGWYTGAQAEAFPASFFMLENFYSAHNTVFYRSQQDDVYDGWAIVNPAAEIEVDRPVPVPEELCHELEHMQSVFAHEWLLYADDPIAQMEIQSYRKEGRSARPVNIKARKLNKLVQDGTLWTYATPGMDLNIIGFLGRHWGLDYST
jgi:hypothetical protein